jgi:hypothetical protein
MTEAGGISTGFGTTGVTASAAGGLCSTGVMAGADGASIFFAITGSATTARAESGSS